MSNSGHIWLRLHSSLLLILFGSILLAGISFVPSVHGTNVPVMWHDQGMIFQPATGAYYPTVLYDASAFSGHGDGYYFKMWYSTGSGIALAYSNDGKLWTTYNNGQNLLTLTNAHHSRVLYDAGGFGGSGVFYKIWYWDDSQLYSISAIRYAESSDGIHWVQDKTITQDTSAKLVDGISPHWNAGSYGPIWLFHNSGASNSGSNPWNYLYVMYYDATTGGVEQIGLAYSSDGISWKLYGTGPVLPVGNTGSWDDHYTTHGSIVRYNGEYLMWYSGAKAGTCCQGIGFAESSDGLTWTKDPSNPIHVNGGPGSWNEKRGYTPTVIYDANKFSGHGDSSEFKMYYSGVDALGNKAIGYKTGHKTGPPPAGTSASTSSGTVSEFGSIPVGSMPLSSAPPQAQPLSFPDGFFDIIITGVAPGSTVTINLTLSHPAAGSQLWKYNTGLAAWQQVPILSTSGNTVQFQLTDGGTFDEDNVAGQITDPIGVGVPPPPVPEYPLGLPLLAIFMLAAYGLIKRRTRNPRSL